MAGSFYQSERVLLVIPQPRGEELRLIEGTRNDGTKYIDLRTWYRDDFDQLKPGKGIGKADVNGVWDAIGKAIVERNISTEPKTYDSKKQEYAEDSDEGPGSPGYGFGHQVED